MEMAYQEYDPHPQLAAYVQCYWTVVAPNASDYRLILPDGCTDLIFNFGDALISKSADGEKINSLKNFIVGNMTRPLYSRSMQHTDILGIRFKAGGMHALVGEPMFLFNDNVVEFDFLKNDNFWFDQLNELMCTTNRIERLNNLLIDTLKPCISKSVCHALKQINFHHGIYKVVDLSRVLGISQKQLERQFKNFVGLTPKQYARVVQFQHIQNLLKLKGEDSLLHLAIDAGYSDHAHFTKSFKQFAGLAPKQYLQQR